jgi:hypothetical protein
MTDNDGLRRAAAEAMYRAQETIGALKEAAVKGEIANTATELFMQLNEDMNKHLAQNSLDTSMDIYNATLMEFFSALDDYDDVDFEQFDYLYKNCRNKGIDSVSLEFIAQAAKELDRKKRSINYKRSGFKLPVETKVSLYMLFVNFVRTIFVIIFWGIIVAVAYWLID